MTHCHVYLFGIIFYNWFYKDKLKHQKVFADRQENKVSKQYATTQRVLINNSNFNKMRRGTINSTRNSILSNNKSRSPSVMK